MQSVLAERSRRLAAEQKAQKERAKAEKDAARAEKKRREGQEGAQETAPTQPRTGAESSYAAQVRKQKLEKAEERRRILERIENDKRERGEKAAKERQARLLLSATTQDGDVNNNTIPSIPLHSRAPAAPSAGSTCNLQVRLLDGATIWNRFASDSTLGDAVRPWVDEQLAGGDTAYTFKVVQTPLPNRSVELHEEAEPLSALGLMPSATLVLVPVRRYAAAYGAAGRSLPHRSLPLRVLAYVYATLYGFLASVYGGFAGRLSGLAGTARRPEGEGGIPMQNLASGPRGIRGLDTADERQGGDPAFYNGNSVSRCRLAWLQPC